MKRIGVIGSGSVGQALADGFLKHGYEVMRGSRDPKKLADWKASAGAKASVGNFAETARYGEAVVLGVKGGAALETLELCGEGSLDGKPVLDATNPISDAPPTHGVLSFFTGPNDSLMERLQKAAPKAQFVKVFNSVGADLMVNPSFGGTRPTMFICGNEDSAKQQVRGFLEQFGWDAEDMGTVEAARAIEPLCILWCIPGLARNQWTHAFHLLKK